MVSKKVPDISMVLESMDRSPEVGEEIVGICILPKVSENGFAG
jgi:hypothetical protein